MKKKIIKLFSRSKTLTKGLFIVNNFLVGLKCRLGLNFTFSGTQSSSKGVPEVYERIKNTYKTYTSFRNDVKGKTILEVGPGDNLGVGLLMIAKGAKKVVCIDAFRRKKDFAKEKEIYLYLISKLNSVEKKRVSKAISFSKGFKFNRKYVVYSATSPFETFSSKEKFDLILSKSVFEHLADVKKALSNSKKLMATNGKQIHYIDISDHGIFSKTHTPFDWLMVHRKVWSAMVSNSGHPNRVLLDGYKKLFGLLELRYKIKVQKIYSVSENEINKIKKKFVKPYCSFSAKSLKVRDFVVLLNK